MPAPRQLSGQLSRQRSGQLTRRQTLRGIAWGTAGLAAGIFPASSALAKVKATDLTVTQIERVTVKVPYRPLVERNMARELPHWKYSEIVSVTLQSGHRGFGETLLYYTWGATTDEAVARVRGKHAAAVMWDDELGAGLQMALFDAVARALDVPIHQLLGKQVHQQTPLSWWNIDTSPEDMASECQRALREGYLAYKTKGRPWFDLWAQVEQSARLVPEEFKIDMDFNDTLLTADKAIPILKELEAYPQVSIYETPIPQADLAGNRRIREATRVDVAMHYGRPNPKDVIVQQACDGFVIGGGASRVMQQGHVAAMADMPFWLQLVGTGITAAFSLHFGAVLSHATWPAVNCHQLYQHTLLKQPIRVRRGVAEVPAGPGLGYDLDWDAIERYRVAKPARRPEPARLLETRWPDGRRMYVASTGKVNFMLDFANEGTMPYFERGVTTRLVPDDGSPQWKQRYTKARQAPFLEPANSD